MKRQVYYIAALALIASARVFALDGEVLVSQAWVQAYGGFPYNITQAGRYKLTGNLVASSSSNAFNAINIAVDNVTLDLNGFTISCPTCGSKLVSIAVNTTGKNTAVMNGTITGFSAAAQGFGIQFTQASGRVEHMNLNANTYAIQMNASTVSVTDTAISGNLGLAISNSNSILTVQNSQITSNGEGIVGTSGTFQIMNNLFAANGSYGLLLNGVGSYGLNTFEGNSPNVQVFGSVVSLGNNVCGGALC